MHYTKQALKHVKCEIGMFFHPSIVKCLLSIVKFHEVPLTALQKFMLFAVLISQSTQHANYRKYITNLA